MSIATMPDLMIIYFGVSLSKTHLYFPTVLVARFPGIRVLEVDVVVQDLTAVVLPQALLSIIVFDLNSSHEIDPQEHIFLLSRVYPLLLFTKK